MPAFNFGDSYVSVYTHTCTRTQSLTHSYLTHFLAIFNKSYPKQSGHIYSIKFDRA